MIPIEPACSYVNPNANAPKNVAKIATCAAAQRRKLFGLANNGPKSVIQPTPRKIKHG